MARIGFVGPTYASQSLVADAQRCVNFYPEVIESGAGKGVAALYRTPGLKVFATPTKADSANITNVEVNRYGDTQAAIESTYIFDGHSAKVAAGDGIDWAISEGQADRRISWSNPENAGSSSSYASATLPAYPGSGSVYVTNYLIAGEFDFALEQNIPSGATVTGIYVSLDASCSAVGSRGSLPMGFGLRKSGVRYSDSSYRDITTTPTTIELVFGSLGSVTFDDLVHGLVACDVWVQSDMDAPESEIHISNVRMWAVFTGAYLGVKCDAACPFEADQQVICSGLTTASWLNDMTLAVGGVSGDYFSATLASSHTGYDEDFVADTGNAYNLIESQAVITLDDNIFSVGQNATFSALQTATFLNGNSIEVRTSSGLVIKGTFAHADYAPAEDTGVMLNGDVAQLPRARGIYSVNGNRLFAVVSDTLFEVMADGTFENRGTVDNDDLPASMTSSAVELLIASAGKLYKMTLATNAFAAVPHYKSSTSDIPAVVMVDYCDGYFLALLADSQKWIVSDPMDGASWDATQTAQVSVFPDNVLSMLVSRREVWLFGAKRTIVYYDSGNTFPFDVNPSGIIDQGTAAGRSPVRLDNSVFWLGADERGSGVAWRASGYTPVRVSNHAIEYAWSQYSTISDAIGYGYQDQGHSFYVLYFPTAHATWVFDAATGLWHERAFWDGANYTAHRSQNHAFCFGKHIVGDWDTVNLYEMSIAYRDDFGNPIRRMRRAPHVSIENQWITHNSLQLDMEAGIGPTPDLTDANGAPRGPEVTLRWSDDELKTWSNPRTESAGKAGEYRKRVIWRRLGRSRDRVYEVVVSDPINWSIVDAYLDANPGYGPTERMASQMRKQT